MTTVMVVDDEAIIREPISESLRRAGFETMTATNGHEGLRHLTQRKPDLILLDLSMPVMGGKEFLQSLRAAPPPDRHIPVIMLTASSDKTSVIESAKLGVNGYLLKSRFSLPEMIAQVRKVLEQHGHVPAPQAKPAAADPQNAVSEGKVDPPASPPSPTCTAAQPPRAPAAITPADAPEAEGLRALKPIIHRSEITALIDKCGELKGFSPAVHEVIKLTGNDRCAIDQIAKAISRDHAIALKILKLANSAVYTRGEHVDSVLKAVLRIGLGQIRQAVLNIAVVDQYSSSAISGFINGSQFWEHAIATGIISAEIAHARHEKEADAAFTIGLLHDVGRMVFVSQLGDTYRHVLQTAQDMQLPLEQVEHRMLCYSHADIMDRVFRQWKFAKEFINPIVFHHLSAGNMRDAAPQEVQQVATLGLANRLAHAFMLGSSGNETIYPTEDICDLLHLDSAVVHRIENIARDETDKVKFALLAQSNQANWAQLREVHRARLQQPFVPLYVSSAPAIDAHRMFCDQLKEADGDERPNIGIINFRHGREKNILSQQYLTAEKREGVSNLPLLVISPAGKVAPEPSLLEGRPVQMIATPIPIARFIDTVNGLLAGPALQKAA